MSTQNAIPCALQCSNIPLVYEFYEIDNPPNYVKIVSL